MYTFRLIDKEGKSTFVKFHWKPKLGLQSVVWNEAVKINGADPDFHRRDLWNSIQRGDFPEWELGLQLFDEKFAENFDFDVLDATKLIPEEEVPIRIVGRLVLDRVVDNFFAETEQVAFCTSNVVPGIDFSNDPLLAGRNFSYLDTQLKRLGGPNFTHITINAPKCPFANFMQDGHMAMQNPKGRINYEPNSSSQALPKESLNGFKSFSGKEEGSKMRIRPESFSDHYSQARQFYISQTPIEQAHIKDALVFELSKVEQLAIRTKIVSYLLNIDANLAKKVADGLGFDNLPAAISAAKATRMDLKPSNALGIINNSKNRSFKGRKLGILLTDGADSKLFKALQDTVVMAGGIVEIIAPKISGVKMDDGSQVEANHTINGGPSVLFDTIVLLVSEEAMPSIINEPAARDFVADAFAHMKYIGYTFASQKLLKKAGIFEDLDEACIMLNLDNAKEFIIRCDKLRFWKEYNKS